MQIARLVVVTVDFPPKGGKTQPLGSTKLNLRNNMANIGHEYSFAVCYRVIENLN
jgi:hypothetical protein